MHSLHGLAHLLHGFRRGSNLLGQSTGRIAPTPLDSRREQRGEVRTWHSYRAYSMSNSPVKFSLPMPAGSTRMYDDLVLLVEVEGN